MNDLVRRLCEGDHPVEIVVRPKVTVEGLRECIERKYVHIRFTDTKGGTELGVALDLDSTDLQHADFQNQSGSIKFVGNLTLNYVKVRCIANVDLKTFTGNGHLETVQEAAQV